MRFIYRLIFIKILGWKILGNMPRYKKYIIVVAPHTSNFDFLIGLCVRSILKFESGFLAKKELFRFPFGGLFRMLGGHPVDRSRHTNLVDAVAALFNSHDRFVVAIAPEGTRKYVSKWKTGFYFMAQKAEVPLVLASFNYGERTVFISEPFFPTGDREKDSESILSFFRNKKGKFPKEIPGKLFSE